MTTHARRAIPGGPPRGRHRAPLLNDAFAARRLPASQPMMLAPPLRPPKDSWWVGTTRDEFAERAQHAADRLARRGNLDLQRNQRGW